MGRLEHFLKLSYGAAEPLLSKASKNLRRWYQNEMQSVNDEDWEAAFHFHMGREKNKAAPENLQQNLIRDVKLENKNSMCERVKKLKAVDRWLETSFVWKTGAK